MRTLFLYSWPDSTPARHGSPSLATGRAILAVLGLCMAVSMASAAPQTVRINLGTLAPRGSLYHQSLQSMGESWRNASEGKIKLVIYPDGTQGGEADMVRLMRIGTLHAGLLTAVGLADIEPGVSGLQTMPMMFRSLEEFEHINEQLRPRLEKRLLDKGFVVLFWVDAGWVRCFSKEPILQPDDMKRAKLFVWAGSNDQVEMLKHAGYNPVPLETTEILTGFQTGLINALFTPPVYALAGQLDLRAPHMLELNWAPLVGAAVVKREVWEKSAPAIRKGLMDAAAATGKEIQAKSRQENHQAVAAMQKRGLTVHKVNPELDQQWRTSTEKFYPEIRGRLVPADIFDEVGSLLNAYRTKAANVAP